jgi:CheY-like chemotaxis protein
MNQSHVSDTQAQALSLNSQVRFADREASSLRILIAEDNGALRRLLALVLMRDGHEVVQTSDAGELLEALASALIEDGGSPYDLVICEHTLPGIVGLAVLAGLRARDRVTPFILITGDEDVQKIARRLGAVVLDHPFNVAAIRGAIQQSAALVTAAND